MPYTLAMGTIWFVLALLVGLLIGWLLRSIIARRQVERARAYNASQAELDRLNARIRSLELERDELRAGRGADRPAAESAGQDLAGQDISAEPTSARSDTVPAAPPDGAVDLTAAGAVLGREIERDDLQVVEGIGPNIDDLLRGIGIRTWRDLADTEVSLLTTMLNDAGARFQSADPSTWPQQASLLAAGRWTDFADLAEQVRSSTP